MDLRVEWPKCLEGIFRVLRQVLGSAQHSEQIQHQDDDQDRTDDSESTSSAPARIAVVSTTAGNKSTSKIMSNNIRNLLSRPARLRFL